MLKLVKVELPLATLGKEGDFLYIIIYELN